MLSYVVDIKFQKFDHAKIANSYINNSMNNFLSIDGITGINTFIGQNGEIAITVKFENKTTLPTIESRLSDVLNSLKATMLFQSRTFFSVCSYQYEKEGVSTEI